ncbi:MAG TPA: DUF881 domain-containing protein [Clostridia bacterium]|jgi:uncharacterized protein YlxW (UPF0749 family)|nr:DUF881 domain-containing protein [Clostridia bacterium]HHY06269.1 DUF881 domain-containing protein [Clostridia bacterium]
MRKYVLPLTVVCIISGFFLAFQLKVQTKSTNYDAVSQKNANLINVIQALEKEIENQENQIETMRNQLNEIQNQNNKGKLQDLQQEIIQAKINAGLTPVIGKGIIITLDDNKEGLLNAPNDDPNKYIIHYEHLLNLVNELKIGGAEAISINGQRLVTTSEIRCVGNLILINTTRIAPPFEVCAIGSPKLMVESISLGQLDLLKTAHYPVALAEKENLTIPAYKGELQFKYAIPQ